LGSASFTHIQLGFISCELLLPIDIGHFLVAVATKNTIHDSVPGSQIYIKKSISFYSDL